MHVVSEKRFINCVMYLTKCICGKIGVCVRNVEICLEHNSCLRRGLINKTSPLATLKLSRKKIVTCEECNKCVL